MIKRVLFILIFAATYLIAEDYQINKMTLNQIDGKLNNIAEEKSNQYMTWNNFNDFIVMVHVVGKDPKKEYFQNGRELILYVHDNKGKELYKDKVDSSYLNAGGVNHWFLIRNTIMRCGEYNIKAKLSGQKEVTLERKVYFECGE